MKKRRRKYKMALVHDGLDGGMRRVKVVLFEGIKGFVVRFTSACSGCADDREYVSCDKGSGCHECGYTGLARRAEWVPLNGKEMAKQDAQYEARERKAA